MAMYLDSSNRFHPRCYFQPGFSRVHSTDHKQENGQHNVRRIQARSRCVMDIRSGVGDGDGRIEWVESI